MALLSFALPAHAVELLDHGRFAQVRIFRPQNDVQQVVLFLSDARGWTAEETSLALALTGEHALVAGIALDEFEDELAHDGTDCVSPDGDLENLSHFIQAYYQLPGYRVPMLVGTGEGAAFAYAVIAQAAQGVFGGALSIDFCPRLKLDKPLCAGTALHTAKVPDVTGVELSPAPALESRWIVLRGADDPACSLDSVRNFVASISSAQLVVRPGHARGDLAEEEGVALVRSAYRRLGQSPTPNLPVVPGNLSDLPLVEVPAHGNVDAMAIFISGDGGWAGLDEHVAAAIAVHGIPVVGFDSLRYFWKPRTPESVAADIDRTLRYYLAHWNKSRALLFGYSQGANVLPFVVNRLPQTTRGRVAFVAMMGLGATANFEFHLSNWVSKDQSGAPILPEITKLAGVRALCVYGEDEGGSLCPELATTSVGLLKLPGGHHFGGDYDKLATLLLDRAGVK